MKKSAWLYLILAGLLVPAAIVQGQQKKLFRWGGDKAGGAPFIFDAVENGVEKQLGFESELAEYFAGQLEREAKFVQADWDTLPQVLNRGGDASEIDVAMNGIEFSKDRAAQGTVPYFIYTLRLIVRTDSKIANWDDLKPAENGRKLRVGVLRDTFAHKYLTDHFEDLIEIVPTREVVEAFQLMEQSDGSRMDACVQDSPCANYYIAGGRYPKLKIVAEPRAKNYYIILTRENDVELREKLNQAIKAASDSGLLERIYRKYNLWDEDQAKLVQTLRSPWPPEESEAISKRTLGSLQSKILSALWMTVALSFLAMPIAIALGILIAIGRVYGSWILRFPLAVYVEVIRGTPLLLQIFVIYYVLPDLAKATESKILMELAALPAFFVGVIGLAINYSAYESEIYRAGIQSIPRGQMEAALSLGLRRGQAIRHVILPQAIRLVIPPVTNDFINMFKDTSVCSMIMITELTGLYYQNKSDQVLAYQLAIVIAILYMALSYPLSLVARGLENRLRKAMA